MDLACPGTVKAASEAVESLRGKLSTTELQELTSVLGRLPTWVAKQVSALVHG